MDEAPDGEVTAAFSKGQPDALALVYQRFGALVFTIALRSLGVRAAAGPAIGPAGYSREFYTPG